MLSSRARKVALYRYRTLYQQRKLSVEVNEHGITCLKDRSPVEGFVVVGYGECEYDWLVAFEYWEKRLVNETKNIHCECKPFCYSRAEWIVKTKPEITARPFCELCLRESKLVYPDVKYVDLYLDEKEKEHANPVL